MKHALLILTAMVTLVRAEPVVSHLDWLPACDGSTIEVISDQGKLKSIHASAVHSTVVVEWSVHYADGVPVSAEYREWKRGRILEGERAGDYSGQDTLKEIQTWVWKGDDFPIKDEARARELADILKRALDQVALRLLGHSVKSMESK